MSLSDSPRPTYAGLRSVALTLSGLLMVTTTIRGADVDPYATAQQAFHQATAAYQQQDYTTFVREAAAAVTDRPDHPTYRYYLAAGYALTDQPAACAAELTRIAAWGLYVPARDEPDFHQVTAEPAVQTALAALDANLRPHGTTVAAAVVTFPAEDGLWEGLVHEPVNDQTYLSDLRHGRIAVRTSHGALRRFADLPDRGFGCAGLALDPTRGLLWVSAPALPEVEMFLPDLTGQSRLYAFHLEDGRLAHVITLPTLEPHAVADLTVARDGTVYASDSATPVIWRVAPDANVAEAWVRVTAPGARHSLQRLALTDDDRWLIVADYSIGLHCVNTRTGATTFCSTTALAPATTLIGLDGLARHENTLLAVQNGVRPQRVLQLTLHYDPAIDQPPQLTECGVLAAGQPDLVDPTLATATADGFLVIGNAGWQFSRDGTFSAPLNRTVPVLFFPATPSRS